MVTKSRLLFRRSFRLQTPYTADGLKFREDNPGKMHAPHPDQQYQLSGVVVHSGQAGGGHYYSFIQPRDGKGGKWLRFDDSDVCAT